MRRTINIEAITALSFLLLVAACSSTPAAETTSSLAATSTTEPTAVEPTPAEQALLQYDADVELISQLWWDQNLAWADGFDAGIEFWADNNYPDLECEYGDYLASQFPDGPVEGLVVERLVNKPTIVRDDGWIVPGGLVAGTEAKGRIYVMEVQSTRITPDTETASPETGSLHVTVLDDRAHFFFGC